jgi:hypothetical protein
MEWPAIAWVVPRHSARRPTAAFAELVNNEPLSPRVVVQFIRVNLKAFLEFHKSALAFDSLDRRLSFRLRGVHANEQFNVLSPFGHLLYEPEQINLVIQLTPPQVA